MRVQVSRRYPQLPDAVFAYLSDPRNMPMWNSAVTSVEPLTPMGPAAGARYLMRRDIPSGPAANELEVVVSVPPTQLVIRTLTGPTPFTYHYTLEGDGNGTMLRLDGDVELGGAIARVGPLAARFVERGIATNLETLGRILDAR
jgi:uncharacterized protein YndB with AHSA1/START domain